MANKMMVRRFIEAFMALVLGRRVPVHWGSQAASDSFQVELPDPVTCNAEEVALLTRLALHEAGHIVHTQPGFDSRLTEREKVVFNLLEDPRMERQLMQSYPGATVVLSRGLDEMLKSIRERVQANPNGLATPAAQADLFFRGLLAAAPHKPVLEHVPVLLATLEPHVTARERAAIDEAITKLPAFASSLDAEAAARAFLARLDEQEPLPNDAEQQEQGPDANAEPYAEPQQLEQPAPPEEGAQHPGEDAGQPNDDIDGTVHPAEPQEQQGQQEPERSAPAEGPGDSQPDPTSNGGAEGDDGGQQVPGADQNDAGQLPQGGGAADGEGASEKSGGAGEGAEAGEGAAAPAQGASGMPGDPQDAGGADNEGAQSGSAGAGQTEGNGESHDPSSGTHAPGESSGAAQGGDLGDLLRQVLAQRYGCAGSDSDTIEAAQEHGSPKDEDLQRLAAVLSKADPEADLGELLQASLAAVAAAGDACDADATAFDGGAGMQLTGPVVTTMEQPAQSRLEGVQAQLVNVLRRELQDKRRRPVKAAPAGSRVLPGRFWRLGAVGDTKVFAKQHNVNGIDAAATVFLDSSESMTDQFQFAMDGALAFSMAMQRLGVQTKVVRFPGAATVCETLQQFGESPRSCKERCAHLVPAGGTPIGAAVASELPQLMQQRQLLKMIIVITDDGPGDADTYVAALNLAAQMKVQVVGVGIGCDISQWIEQSVAVADVTELPGALSRLFREHVAVKLAA